MQSLTLMLGLLCRMELTVVTTQSLFRRQPSASWVKKVEGGAEICNSPTDGRKFLTNEITSAQNFIFASILSQNRRFSASNFVFLEADFLTKIKFLHRLQFKERRQLALVFSCLCYRQPYLCRSHTSWNSLLDDVRSSSSTQLFWRLLKTTYTDTYWAPDILSQFLCD